MRYLVKARVRSGRQCDLTRAIDEGTLGKGSIAGAEYLWNMQQARVNEDGVATWVETCFVIRRSMKSGHIGKSIFSCLP